MSENSCRLRVSDDRPCVLIVDHDAVLYKQPHKIENLFGRLKDWRRIHTRYDRCAHTYFSAIGIAQPSSSGSKNELTAHMSSSRRSPWRATPRQSIKVGPAKGLDRKQIAPSCSARARVVSSGKAVMKMNGAP
jgi:hypothetical protein